nr:acetate--CoA ligase family protein [Mangrovicoccus ximenensis]
MKVLMKHGYDGRIYPVTRSAAEVEGLRAWPSVADLPEVPDLALIITPAATVPDILEDCGRKGIETAVVFSAGFEETEAGRGHARRLAEVAARHGIAVLGPNGQGLWSVGAKSFFSFSAAAMALDGIRHAPIALVSQSGALAGAIGGSLHRNGMGCSYMVSVGNETCLDALDVLEWIIEQEDVRVAALYLEGIDRGARLQRIGARARSRGVQIVALKAGRSAFGQEATASHTGKMASAHEIYRDTLAQAGIIMVESLGEALAAIEVFSFMPGPRVSGDPLGGISVMSSSGGAAALLADHSAEHGVPMAVFSPGPAARLEARLPEFARKANPVDLTGQIRAEPDLFRNTLEIICDDPRTEAVVVQFASSGLRDLVENGSDFKAAVRRTGLPLVVTTAQEQVDVATRAEFRDAGILISDDPFNTMRALSWLYDRRGFAAIRPGPAVPAATLPAPQGWDGTVAFLSGCGLDPAPWRLLHPGDDPAEACAGLAWPLVVKVLPDAADHKTELGLVKLRVQTPEEVAFHADAFRRSLGRPDLPVLVQEMVTDGVEVVLACLRDSDFGPVLSIGSGGIAVELYRDVAYLALPATHAQVEASLRKLKLWTLLQGFRGAPEADVAALVDAVVRFGERMAQTPSLREAEINPVMVRPKGKGLAAVDFIGIAAD